MRKANGKQRTFAGEVVRGVADEQACLSDGAVCAGETNGNRQAERHYGNAPPTMTHLMACIACIRAERRTGFKVRVFA